MKFLINGKTDKALDDLNTEEDIILEGLKSRHQFISKQMESFADEVKKVKKERWNKIESRLRDMGVLTDSNYNPEKERICFNEKSHDYWISDKVEKDNIGEILSKLLGR